MRSPRLKAGLQFAIVFVILAALALLIVPASREPWQPTNLSPRSESDPTDGLEYVWGARPANWQVPFVPLPGPEDEYYREHPLQHIQ